MLAPHITACTLTIPRSPHAESVQQRELFDQAGNVPFIRGNQLSFRQYGQSTRIRHAIILAVQYTRLRHLIQAGQDALQPIWRRSLSAATLVALFSLDVPPCSRLGGPLWPTSPLWPHVTAAKRVTGAYRFGYGARVTGPGPVGGAQPEGHPTRTNRRLEVRQTAPVQRRRTVETIDELRERGRRAMMMVA